MTQQGSITISGFVAADPVTFGESQGLRACSLRLGSTRSYYNNAKQEWNEQPTTWITVKAFRQLAQHVKFSVHKGDPLIVTGLLNTETWMQDGVRRSRIVIEANAIGHDLSLGVSTFQRLRSSGNGNARADQGTGEGDYTVDVEAEASSGQSSKGGFSAEYGTSILVAEPRNDVQEDVQDSGHNTGQSVTQGQMRNNGHGDDYQGVDNTGDGTGAVDSALHVTDHTGSVSESQPDHGHDEYAAVEF